MANNRGAYDPRQFLHYPEKNPFSEEAQKRLEHLVEDFLRVGIAFANGAGVQDFAVEEKRGKFEPKHQFMNGVVHLEQDSLGLHSFDDVADDDEDEQYERSLPRVDKGKGRDEREGPGLRGLRARTEVFASQGSPPQRLIADDEQSVFSGSYHGEGVQDDAEDGEDLREDESFGDEMLEDPQGDQDGYQEDGSESGTELEATHSHEPSPEREVIYIGDSDEEEPKSRVLSDIDAEEGFLSHSELAPLDTRGSQFTVMSGSDGAESGEHRPGHVAWHANDENDEEEGEDHEWQSPYKGKESDEDEGHPLADQSRDRSESPSRVYDNRSASHFFTDAFLDDPGSHSYPQKATDLPRLPPLACEPQPLQGDEDEEREEGNEANAEEELGSNENRMDNRGVYPDSHADFQANGYHPSLDLRRRVENEPSILPTTDVRSDMGLHVHSHTNESTSPLSTPDNAELKQGDFVRALDGNEITSDLHFSTFDDQRHHDISFSSDRVAHEDAPLAPQNLSSVLTNAVEDTHELSSMIHSASKYPPVDSNETHVLGLIESSPPTDVELSHFDDPSEMQASAFTVENVFSSRGNGTPVSHAGSNQIFVDDYAAQDHSSIPMLRTAIFHSCTPEPQEQRDRFCGDLAPSDQVDELIHPSQTPGVTGESIDVSSHPSQEGRSATDNHFPFHDSPASAEPCFSTGAITNDGWINPTEPTPEIQDRALKSPSTSMADVRTTNIEHYNLAAADDDDKHDPDALDQTDSKSANGQDHTADDMSQDEKATSSDGDNRMFDGNLVDSSDPSVRGPATLISLGSSTPPLSPTATVTNCSSAPDPSVATSDLSTANPATVSVVTSSPPRIHVSRPFSNPVDIREPVGTGSTFDEEGEDETALPDPRLPPEPTHLRIPVGVVSRGLVDKEERTESVKVEPPTPQVRSESEDDSVTDLGEVHNGEMPAMATEFEKSTEPKRTSPSTSSHIINDSEHGTDEHVELEATDIPLELNYPDSDYGDLDENRDLIPSPDHHPFDTFDGERSLSPSHAHKHRTRTPSLSPNPENPPSLSQVNDDPHDELVDDDPGLDIKWQTAVHPKSTSGTTINGGPVKDSLIHEFSTEPASPDGNPIIHTPLSVSSPRESTHNEPRTPAKRKTGDYNGSTSLFTQSETGSQPPQSKSTIRTQSGDSRKRSREPDSPCERSKQCRLIHSDAAGGSTLGDRDGVFLSAVSEDSSDVFSAVSSSTAVSRMLHVMSPNPSFSEFFPSRSPSVVSQSSPTSVEAPPMRPYVPHNHGHHHPRTSPTSPSIRRRTTPAPQQGPFVSSPSTPSHTTSTHQTRASCTDHKISVPGPHGLLYFLIPRCSLMNPEVEKDDAIVDCGVATKEEVKRAIGDIEAIGLSSEILGVIRQVTGVQLMREGQVGYLPQSGERLGSHRKKKQTHVGPPPSLIQDDTLQTEKYEPPRAESSRSTPSDIQLPVPSSGSPVSNASPVESDHGRQTAKGTDDVGYKPDLQGDDDGEESGHDGETVTTAHSASSPKSVRLTKSHKSRRRGLRKDDVAYKPEQEDSESSSDSESPGMKSKGKGGLKRKRNEAPGREEWCSTESASPNKKKRWQNMESLGEHDEEAVASHGKTPKRKTNGTKDPFIVNHSI